MPYDAEKASDVSSMKEKLSKTYSGVDDTAARQAIHVWNSVMDGGGDEGRAWASVYSAMNKRGLGKKAAARVASRFLTASAASRVAQRHLEAAQPTLKLLADTIARMAIVDETTDGYTQQTIEPKKAEQILKRWFAHADKEGAMYADITVGNLKKDSWNRWSLTPNVRDTFKSGSKQVWVSWEGSDKLYVTIERDGNHWDVSITDRQGRIVFDSDSIPKATPSQVILALVMDRPRFISTRVWQEENDHREERVEDWATD